MDGRIVSTTPDLTVWELIVDDVSDRRGKLYELEEVEFKGKGDHVQDLLWDEDEIVRAEEWDDWIYREAKFKEQEHWNSLNEVQKALIELADSLDRIDYLDIMRTAIEYADWMEYHRVSVIVEGDRYDYYIVNKSEY